MPCARPSAPAAAFVAVVAAAVAALATVAAICNEVVGDLSCSMVSWFKVCGYTVMSDAAFIIAAHAN